MIRSRNNFPIEANPEQSGDVANVDTQKVIHRDSEEKLKIAASFGTKPQVITFWDSWVTEEKWLIKF